MRGIYEKRGLSLRSSEAQMQKLNGKPVKPSPGCLLQSIKGLMEFTNMMRIRRINIPRRLLHIYLLLKVAMKEGI